MRLGVELVGPVDQHNQILLSYNIVCKQYRTALLIFGDVTAGRVDRHNEAQQVLKGVRDSACRRYGG